MRDTAPLPEITLPELFAEWDVAGRRVPVEGVLEPTFRCNLRCVHCYVNQPAGSAEEQAREVPTARLRSVIDEIADAGCLNLLMTGGEVLLRPDFEELYRHARGRGLLITVFTNGTLVTDRIADLFDRERPLLIEVSLYGMTRETYERITGVPGSFERCLAGIRRLVDRGLPLKLKTMAMAWNAHEVADMQAFAASLGVAFRYDGLLNARVDCGASRHGDVQLPPRDLLALELEDPEQRAKLLASADHVRALAAREDLAFEQVYTCGAGQVSFTVDPYGRMQMCQLSRKAAFDLSRESFATIWDERFGALRARSWQTDAACRTCSLQPLCGSCPGAAELESGDIEAQVPHFCEIAHLRAHALGASSGHREDATCCLGHGSRTTLPAATGCGGCGHREAAPAPLVQIERRRRVSA